MRNKDAPNPKADSSITSKSQEKKKIVPLLGKYKWSTKFDR